MAITYHAGRRIQGLSDTSLVAHLKFNDNVTDSAGSNNGTVTGTTTYVAGKVDKAFSFNGSSYVTLANESNFDFDRTDSFSVSLWLKTGTEQDIKMLVGKSEINALGWHIWMRQGAPGDDNGDIHFNLVSTNTTNEIETRIQVLPMFDDTWHHLVWTYDGTSDVSGVHGYWDGVEISKGSGTNNLTSSILNNLPVSIGDSPNGGGRDYTGSMDDVRIYSRELDQSEVTMIYNSGTGTEGTKPANVQVGSRFEETDTRKIYHKADEYIVHTFTTTGNQNFVVTGSGDADILVVAGGGAGGYYGAGGGAGGVLYGTNISLTTGTYVVDVGAGGTPSTSHGSRPTNASGEDSQFGSLTLAKGGGEGGHGATGTVSDSTGDPGGSGGGGSHGDSGGTSNQTTGSSLTIKFGTSGGNGRTGFASSNEVSAGGGGAGAGGVQGDTSGNGGAGGAGTSSSISGSAVTYAGGGGGGTNTDHFSGSQVGGVGGSSIGGNGASASVSGVAGTSNTGSGGGGGNLGGSANNYGGAGGSGIVIVRYIDDGSITATGGDTVTTTGGAWTEEGT